MAEIRNETYDASGLVAADLIDLTAGTYAREEYGVIVATRALTADEVAAYMPPVDPRAELLAQVAAATTVTKLRAAVLAAIDAGAL